MDEKRYQVFVSSTFRDLQEERREVVQALLELHCFPIGMELFPASDEAAWNYICQVIDDCDYYLLIIGGRYGSVDEAGISFTEKEYDYAVSKQIPVLAFLHGEPGKIPAEKSELQPAAATKLQEFREKVQKAKLCKFWTTASELGGLVSRSYVQLIRQRPAIGWVRGNRVLDDGAAQTINRLRTENDELKRQLNIQAQQGPPGAEELAQGEEKFALRYKFFLRHPTNGGVDEEEIDEIINLSWNEIFLAVGTAFLVHNTGRVDNPIVELIERVMNRKSLPGYQKTVLNKDNLNSIRIQLMALGLIEGRGMTWRLTLHGKEKLLKLKAIKRTQ